MTKTCTRCGGKGGFSYQRPHLGISGLCFRCDGTGLEPEKDYVACSLIETLRQELASCEANGKKLRAEYDITMANPTSEFRRWAIENVLQEERTRYVRIRSQIRDLESKAV